MAPRFSIAALAALAATGHLAAAQQPDSSTPPTHPLLTTWKCTTSGGCVAQDTSVVIDWNYHWIHTLDDQSCTTSSGVNKTLCPDQETCSENCVISPADYSSTGASTSGDVLTMNQYRETDGTYTNASPRLYLLGSDGDYVMMQLLGQELTFTVDLSNLPCGENGALYLSQMDATGGRNQYNKGGAEFGAGYCDAQCPVQTWRNGTIDGNSVGFCCNEMDILESNSQAAAFTPHPCNDETCDKSGCGFNPYAQGNKNYWAPGGTLDTSKPFTVTTQFVTDDGTTTGTLSKITRKYIQDGQEVPSSVSGGDSITESWCNVQDSGAAQFGGLTTMGEALGEGMVLVFSVWNDGGQFMNWLDSGSSGPCSATEGNPATIQANNPTTHVIFSNIRWGDIGSTTSDGSGCDGADCGGSSSSSSSASFTTSTKTTLKPSTTSTKPVTTTKAAPPAGPTQTHWGQCGGQGYSGPTQCGAPYSCATQNPYYAQCL